MSTPSHQSTQPWTFKAHKKEIITGIVIALLLGIGGFIWNNISEGSKEVLAKQGIKETLEKYATDINNNSFDANYYFANSVPQFFEEKDSSPRLINEYWHNQFEKVFQNNHIRFDYETLTVDCKEDCYKAYIVLYHSYFKTTSQEQVNDQKSEYDLKFDEQFKIVEVTQKVWE